MSKYVRFLLGIVLFSLVMNLQAQDETRILVAYFTRAGVSGVNSDTDVVASASLRMKDGKLTGNAEVLAEMIHDRVGGALVQIKTVKTYPEKYREHTDMALQEQRKEARPVLQNRIDTASFDVIFLCSPLWWGTFPMPLFTFLESGDFEGKEIIPFITHEGSGFGRSIENLSRMAAGAAIREGLDVRGSRAGEARNNLNRRLEELGY